MRILALDFGCKTGWAFSDGDHIESGVQEFRLERGESTGMRFLRFNAWLNEVLSITKPSIAVYERAHHRGGWATELLLGMVTRLQEKCAQKKIEFMAVHSATLKKFATGHGNASKDEMREAVLKLGPKIPIDDNETDALLLFYYAREKLKIEVNKKNA